jgi:macrolide transport system ATP-binding/permease protein
MGQLLQDLRYALRQLRNAPRFTAAAITTLALGIGVSTAAFTLFHGMLLQSLPVAEPQQLFRIGDIFTCCEYLGYPESDGDFGLFSLGLYQHLKEAAPEFQSLAATEAGDQHFAVRRDQDAARTLYVHFVSGNYFSTLGARAALGRMLSDTDDTSSAAPVAVLSYEAWQNEFSADPSIVGSTIHIQAYPVVVVGVAQRGFFGDRVTDKHPAIWIPLALVQRLKGETDSSLQAESNWLWLFGRLRTGVDMTLLQSKLSTALRQQLSTTPYYLMPDKKPLIPKQHVILTPTAKGLQSMVERYRAGLELLMLLSSLVLLIACANIANLMLVRAAAREPEISLRVALGAPRARILSQIFAEGILVSCFGGIAGVAVAWIGTSSILHLGFPQATALPIPAAPSLPVLTFALLAALLTGILFSAAPARLSLLSQPVHVLRGYSGPTATLSLLPQKILLILQAALSLVLVCVAVLTARSLYNLSHQETGFASENRYAMRLDVPSGGKSVTDQRELYNKVQSRLASLGGVAGVGLASLGPYDGETMGDCVILADDSKKPPARHCDTNRDQVNPQYFETIGVPILEGRNFNQKDTANSQAVVVVNKALATQVFPNQDPIGKRIARSDTPSNVLNIVGVSGDYKIDAYSPAPGFFYLPLSQNFDANNSVYIQSVIIHFRTKPEDPDGMIRRALAQVDPNISVTYLRSMDSQIAGTLSEERLIADLALLFAILAVTLASVGLYGVASYIAIQRTHEIAIRIALGSTRFGIIRFVLRGVMGQVGIGMLLGIPCVLAAGYWMKDQLFNLPWYDPAGIILAIVLLALCSIAAELIPARRAAAIDPMKALRTE